MSRVTIAAGKDTEDRLSIKEQAIKNELYAESLTFCSTPQELKDNINYTDILVVYSDFSIPYEEVCAMVKESKTVNNIIGMEYADTNKIWLYDGVTVANCIQPGEEAPAIRRALVVPKTVNFISQCVVAILLAFFLTGAVLYTQHQYMASRQTVETSEVEHNELL